MFPDANEKLSAEIVETARKFGADLVGFADVESLKHSPSHRMLSKGLLHPLPEGTEQGVVSGEEPTANGRITWPRDAQTMLIIAVVPPGKRTQSRLLVYPILRRYGRKFAFNPNQQQNNQMAQGEAGHHGGTGAIRD